MKTRTELTRINDHIQKQLKRCGLTSVAAVDAAQWLDHAGILEDYQPRRGLPLRRFLREGLIDGQRQQKNKRWFIDLVR